MIKFLSQIHQIRYLISLVILGCVFVNIGYSQNSKIDSLKTIISKGKKDTTQINALNELSRQLLIREELEEATKVADEALDLANDLDYQKGMAYSLKNKGLVEYYQGNFREVSIFWNESLEIFEAIQDNIGISNLLNNLGATYYNQGSNSKAVEYYLKSFNFAEKSGDAIRITTALLNLGGAYSEMQDYEKALNYLVERVAKAMQHLIKLCGGKGEKF